MRSDSLAKLDACQSEMDRATSSKDHARLDAAIRRLDYGPGQNPASHPPGGSPQHHATLSSHGYGLYSPANEEKGHSSVYRHKAGHEVSTDPKSGEWAAYHKGKYHTGGHTTEHLNRTLSGAKYRDD